MQLCCNNRYFCSNYFYFKPACLIILICTATLIFTFLGGYFALRLQNKLYLILGFSAGAVIGLAFFDLLPTALELSAKRYTPREIASMAGLGFIIYFIIDWGVLFFNALAQKKSYGGLRGGIAAGCLCLHSFLDGVTIGLAFKISARVGLLIAMAVIIHDFADGINTTNVITKGNGGRRAAVIWLTINSAAPVLGAGSTFFFRLTESQLGILLALVSGFFLYLGASDFIPESRLHRPKPATLLMTLLGIFTMFLALQIAAV
jgi:zinc transporter ZupT